MVGSSQHSVVYPDLCICWTDSVVVTVPQPELGGATDQISQEETTRRLNTKAQELQSDRTLTEVCVCVCVCCHECKVAVLYM